MGASDPARARKEAAPGCKRGPGELSVPSASVRNQLRRGRGPPLIQANPAMVAS